MGLGFDNFDADAARYDRQNRMNSPEFPPGQDAGGSDDFDIFGGSSESVGASDPFGGGGGADPFGGGGASDPFGAFNSGVSGMPGMGMPGMGQPAVSQAPPKDDADKFWDAFKVVFKAFREFVSDVVGSFKGLDARFWNRYAWMVLLASIILGVVGVVARLFGLASGLSVTVGACLAAAAGSAVFAFTTESARKMVHKPDPQPPVDSMEDTSGMADGFMDMGMDDATGFGGMGDSGGMDDVGGFDWGDSLADDAGSGEDFSSEFEGAEDFEESPSESVMSPDDALASMPEIDRGMYTRRYLYDMLAKVLPYITPDYEKVTTYTEDDDKFLMYDTILQKCAKQLSPNGDDTPSLLELQESLLVVKFTVSRPKKIKPELLLDEMVKAYAYTEYDEGDTESISKVFGNVITVLDKCVLTVFTGKTALVSLKDLYKRCEDYVLNTKNTIPIVLGFNERGDVQVVDFKKVESIIVSGMPRSGKSWLVQAILTQMCALLSPEEVHFYVIDPKADTSDFKRFTLPHVKKFACRYRNASGSEVNPGKVGIMDTLRFLVNEEAPRRKRLLGGAGFVNISDYNAKNANPLPYIYVIVDEMVTLSEMEKEDEREYQSYLAMIVTQFPNLGIRGMFVPHEVKNQVISKTAYASIKARISVKGNPDHIQAVTGSTPKDFKYKLCNVGDMAAAIDVLAADTVFIHGVAITDSNEGNNEIFDYLRRMWLKLRPDLTSPISDEAEIVSGNNKALAEFNLDNDSVSKDDGAIFTDPNGAGVSGMQAVSGFSSKDEDELMSLLD